MFDEANYRRFKTVQHSYKNKKDIFYLKNFFGCGPMFSFIDGKFASGVPQDNIKIFGRFCSMFSFIGGKIIFGVSKKKIQKFSRCHVKFSENLVQQYFQNVEKIGLFFDDLCKISSDDGLRGVHDNNTICNRRESGDGREMGSGTLHGASPFQFCHLGSEVTTSSSSRVLVSGTSRVVSSLETANSISLVVVGRKMRVVPSIGGRIAASPQESVLRSSHAVSLVQSSSAQDDLKYLPSMQPVVDTCSRVSPAIPVLGLPLSVARTAGALSGGVAVGSADSVVPAAIFLNSVPAGGGAPAKLSRVRRSANVLPPVSMSTSVDPCVAKTSSVEGGSRLQRVVYTTVPRSGGRKVERRAVLLGPPVSVLPPLSPVSLLRGDTSLFYDDGDQESMEQDHEDVVDHDLMEKECEHLPPMLPSVKRRFTKLCKQFAMDDGSTPVADLIALIPCVHPARFSELIQLSTSVMLEAFPLEAAVTPDFKPVQLFELMIGTEAIDSDVSRYVFNMLFVGGGRFPTLYSGERDKTVLCKNGRKLVLPAEVDPYPVKKVRHKLSQKRRHLNLALSEVSAGRCLGPFTVEEAEERFDHFIALSSFVLSKPTAVSTKDRLVHNFSDVMFVLNQMLDNDSMLPVSLDHTSKFIAAVKQRAAARELLHLCTADISKGYRRLFHRRQDVAHLGLRVDCDFDGHIDYFDGVTVSKRAVKKGDVFYVMDRSLPFGLVTSVASFCAVTNMIRDLAQELAGPSVDICCYVDDFGCLGTPENCQMGMNVLRNVLNVAGLPENPLKMQVPSAVGEFLGVVYDFSDPDNVTASLPLAKRLRYIKHLRYYIGRATVVDGQRSLSVTRKELQSIVGKLAYSSFVLSAGRPFYQRLLAVLRGRSTAKHIVLDGGCLDDMCWWVSVLTNHTGSVLLTPHEKVVKVFTDASTTTGYGVYFKGQWFRGEWPEEVKVLLQDFTVDINALELVTLNFCLETLGHELAGSTVHFRCDNLACVSNIHSMSSKRPIRAALLRRLYAVAAHWGITIRSSHIGTKLNVYADTLSRGQLTEFFNLPHLFPLVQVQQQKLGAMALLTDPEGPQNPSTPDWFQSDAFAQLMS